MNGKVTFLMAVITVLSGCASKDPASLNSSLSNSPLIAEQRLTSDFKRQGVKVVYGTLGGLVAIEAIGYAPVWGASANAAREAFRVAELEAKKSLNDFINKESIRSSTSVSMISRNLEKARDERNTKTSLTLDSSDQIISSDNEALSENPSARNEAGNLMRNDALQISSKVQSEITIRNQGILGGLRIIESDVINDGREVRVILRWDKDNENTRKEIRKLMGQ